MNHNPVRIDPYQLVTAIIIEHLERGTVPWHCPWRRDTGRPRNFHTGKPYQGVNVLLLGVQQFASPYWLTFLQAVERGGSVRKGEHGSLVLKFVQYEKRAAKQDCEDEQKSSFYLKGYRVFNATQIEGVEFPTAYTTPKRPALEPMVQAAEIVRKMPQRPVIHEGRSARACHRRVGDTVEVPALNSFDRAELDARPNFENCMGSPYIPIIHGVFWSLYAVGIMGAKSLNIHFLRALFIFLCIVVVLTLYGCSMHHLSIPAHSFG